MRNFKRLFHLPNSITPVFVIILILFGNSSQAVESKEKELFEKNFKSIEMNTIDQKKMKLIDIPSKIIIVNFWASWCIPCLQEMPSLIALSKKYNSKDLSVVAINTDEEEQLKNVQKTKIKLGFPESFTIVLDKKFKIADEYKLSAIPVTIIFNSGKIIYFNNGPVDFLKLSLGPPVGNKMETRSSQ